MYTINNATFDIFVMAFFDVVGYLIKKRGFECDPQVLAFVLGSIVESSTRRSTLICDGDPAGFFTRATSGILLAVLVLVVLCPLLKRLLLRHRLAELTTESPATTDQDSETHAR